MPMKYASKAFRRREREIQRRNSKNLNQLDSDEDDNGNKLNDYEQKRLQNIVDRKNKISELKVNFIFLKHCIKFKIENRRFIGRIFGFPFLSLPDSRI